MSNFHFPQGVQEMHPLSYNHDGSVIKSSHAIAFGRGVNAMSSVQQVNPSTAISSSLATQQTIDFNLQTNGVLESVYAVMVVANGSNTTASTCVYSYLINRCEILDSTGNIAETLFADDLVIGEALFWDSDTFGRMTGNSGTHAAISSTFSTVSIATASSATYLVKIPSFWESSHPNLSTLNAPLRLRFVLSQQNLVTGDSTLVTLSSFYLLVHGHALGENHAADVTAKRSVDQNFRFLKHVRVASEQVSFSSGGSNTVRLSSGVGPCAFMYFTIRPISVSTTGNNLLFQACSGGFELLDRNNNIVGAKILPQTNKMINSSYFPGKICGDKDHLFVIPFCVDPVAARHGQQCGALELDSYHQLRMYTTLSTSYQVDVYAAIYSKATISRDGVLTVQ